MQYKQGMENEPKDGLGADGEMSGEGAPAGLPLNLAMKARLAAQGRLVSAAERRAGVANPVIEQANAEAEASSQLEASEPLPDSGGVENKVSAEWVTLEPGIENVEQDEVPGVEDRQPAVEVDISLDLDEAASAPTAEVAEGEVEAADPAGDALVVVGVEEGIPVAALAPPGSYIPTAAYATGAVYPVPAVAPAARPPARPPALPTTAALAGGGSLGYATRAWGGAPAMTKTSRPGILIALGVVGLIVSVLGCVAGVVAVVYAGDFWRMTKPPADLSMSTSTIATAAPVTPTLIQSGQPLWNGEWLGEKGLAASERKALVEKINAQADGIKVEAPPAEVAELPSQKFMPAIRTKELKAIFPPGPFRLTRDRQMMIDRLLMEVGKDVFPAGSSQVGALRFYRLADHMDGVNLGTDVILEPGGVMYVSNCRVAFVKGGGSFAMIDHGEFRNYDAQTRWSASAIVGAIDRLHEATPNLTTAQGATLAWLAAIQPGPRTFVDVNELPRLSVRLVEIGSDTLQVDGAEKTALSGPPAGSLWIMADGAMLDVSNRAQQFDPKTGLRHIGPLPPAQTARLPVSRWIAGVVVVDAYLGFGFAGLLALLSTAWLRGEHWSARGGRIWSLAKIGVALIVTWASLHAMSQLSASEKFSEDESGMSAEKLGLQVTLGLLLQTAFAVAVLLVLKNKTVSEYLAYRAPGSTPVAVSAALKVEPTGKQKPPRRLCLIASGLAGVAALGYAVVWVREPTAGGLGGSLLNLFGIGIGAALAIFMNRMARQGLVKAGGAAAVAMLLIGMMVCTSAGAVEAAGGVVPGATTRAVTPRRPAAQPLSERKDPASGAPVDARSTVLERAQAEALISEWRKMPGPARRRMRDDYTSAEGASIVAMLKLIEKEDPDLALVSAEIFSETASQRLYKKVKAPAAEAAAARPAFLKMYLEVGSRQTAVKLRDGLLATMLTRVEFDELIKRFRTDPEEVKFRALLVLSLFRDQEAVGRVKALLDGLTSQSMRQLVLVAAQRPISSVMAQQYASSEPAYPQVVPAWEQSVALSKAEGAAVQALTALMAKFESEDPVERLAAIDGLLRLNEDVKKYIPGDRIVAAMEDPDHAVSAGGLRLAHYAFPSSLVAGPATVRMLRSEPVVTVGSISPLKWVAPPAAAPNQGGLFKVVTVQISLSGWVSAMMWVALGLAGVAVVMWRRRGA